MWPQARAVRVLVLLWRGDPRAREEKAKLDREVGGLEPFLEGIPTVLVIFHMRYYKAGCQKIYEPNIPYECMPVRLGFRKPNLTFLAVQTSQEGMVV